MAQIDDLPTNELLSLIVFGTLNVFDDSYTDDLTQVSTTASLAQANFQRNIAVGGDIHMGSETSTISGGITTITESGGNIIFKINGTIYTITPTILKYLINLTGDVQQQFSTINNNLTTLLVSTLVNYITSTSLTTTLADYITSTSLNATLANYITSSSLSTTLANYITSTSLANYVTSSSLSTSLTNYVTNTSLTTTLGGYVSSTALNENYTIGTTANLLTLNSQLLATNGFFSTTLVYNAYTTQYNRFFGNFIMFYNFASAPTGSQLLPVILAGKSTTITFFNNTPYTLQLSANTGSGIYGLVAPVGAQTVSLLSGYTYTFIIFYGASAYDNWFCTVINTNKKLVDEGTDCTIAGTKTFSVAPLFSGTYPASDNSTKLATTAWVKGVGFLTTASLTGLANLNSPNFSGTPTSPTPTTFDNSLKIANTEYVQNSLSSVMSYNQYGVGGDITFTSGIYRYHIFKTNGTITFAKNNSMVNIFMIAGGGAGGRSHGGGGGAGEMVEISYTGSYITAGTVYTVTVGNGGTVTGTVAGNSSFVGGTISVSVNGGGRGGGATNGYASAGGSGGGGSGYATSLYGGQSIKASSGYGTIGGNGNQSTSPNAGGAGGGGGSGSKGSDAVLTLGGAGGAGTSIYFSNYRSAIMSYMPSSWYDATITGFIASGGSGGSWGNAVVAGPTGGGGSGGTKNGGTTYPETPPTKGEDYTGSGGGGGGSGDQEGANGGSGLVVIRYVYNNYVTVDNCITLTPPAHTNFRSSGDIFSKINATVINSTSISTSNSAIVNVATLTLSQGIYMIYLYIPLSYTGLNSFNYANVSISTSSTTLDPTAQQSYGAYQFPSVPPINENYFYLNAFQYVDIVTTTTYYGLLRVYGSATTYDTVNTRTKFYAIRLG